MSERTFRYDLVGTLVPPVCEDCPWCGADANLRGDCTARCEAWRKHAKKDEALEERHG